MGTYETELGYIVRETLGGLEVTEDGEFVCKLRGKCLDDYRYDGDIDDDKLESDITDTVNAEDFLAYQNEYC